MKFDNFFEALGAVDELNAAIGVAREHCQGIRDDVSAAAAVALVV